ncbi:SDR family oxidoreductase [Micromonospora sp. WMMD736]|uniref:SDR family oxidoreductase n=1 Tax=Micromonospora sp. WMMD736 TaxID=3404112 RepID=UPI003B94C0F7
MGQHRHAAPRHPVRAHVTAPDAPHHAGRRGGHRLTPRTAIVTGAASGIGLAIADRLAADGARVAIFDRDGAGAVSAADKLTADGVRAIGLAVDVTDRRRIDEAVAAVADDLGAPAILVNSAGLQGFERFLSITSDSWHQILAVNLTGTFDCCQAVVPHMIDAGWGRIVNISSSSAQTGNPLMTHYSAAKAGVVGFTKALAKELGPRGITVNTIPPGFIDTPMLRDAAQRGFLGPGVAAAEATTPVRRVGTPEDVAAACAFLVRDEAGYLTGQVFGVNGGRTIT